MKRIVVDITLLLASTTFLMSQELSIETFVQKSVLGAQKGYGLYYLNSSGWGLGTVFQSSNGVNAETSGTNYPFYGVEARVPIQNCNRLRLQFASKIGFVNKDFLVILPEIQTEYLVTKNLGLGIGAGIRVREAAISFKVFFQPFKN